MDTKESGGIGLSMSSQRVLKQGHLMNVKAECFGPFGLLSG